MFKNFTWDRNSSPKQTSVFVLTVAEWLVYLPHSNEVAPAAKMNESSNAEGKFPFNDLWECGEDVTACQMMRLKMMKYKPFNDAFNLKVKASIISN